jgi:hypothetical protein
MSILDEEHKMIQRPKEKEIIKHEEKIATLECLCNAPIDLIRADYEWKGAIWCSKMIMRCSRCGMLIAVVDENFKLLQDKSTKGVKLYDKK